MPEPEYFQAVGRAFYEYAYMEWGIVYAIARIRGCSLFDVPVHSGGTSIARHLRRAIRLRMPAFSAETKRALLGVVSDFEAAVAKRNNLFHSNPFTDEGGVQRLGGRGHSRWTLAELEDATNFFVETWRKNAPIVDAAIAQNS